MNSAATKTSDDTEPKQEGEKGTTKKEQKPKGVEYSPEMLEYLKVLQRLGRT